MNAELTELVFILDRSGSMGGLESDTIGGFNGMIERQKKEGEKVNVTTILFDDEVEIIHDRFPIDAVQPLTDKEYYVRGYKNEYTTIKYAYLMMKSVSLMEFSSDIKTLVANYQKESYLIDSYYRWFYYAYDQIEDNSKFSDVRQRVENIYANTYLQKITPKWNENFTNEVMNATDLPKQEDFYKHYLRGYDGKQRVIVIISDAFRYECAKELFGRLELDEKCTPKMECMLSSLPSVTSVGMASLLPHKEMQVDGNLNVTVDGQACASMEQRDKILKSYNENNVALSFDEVANANQARIRELIQGKNIVYIYHNQVDARGDKPASENEVFNACAEAIEEIHKLVEMFTGELVGAGNYTKISKVAPEYKYLDDVFNELFCQNPKPVTYQCRSRVVVRR